jgi:hypothetical protein
MFPDCEPQPQFCTYASSIHGLVLLQKFGCAQNVGHNAVDGNAIFELVNGCATAVYYYYSAGGHGCIRHNSHRAGGFSTIDYFFVDEAADCA